MSTERERSTRTTGEQEADWLLWCAIWRWYWLLRRSLGQGPPVTQEVQGHGVDLVLEEALAQGVLQPDEAAFLRHWVRVEALRAGLRRAKRLAARLEREERARLSPGTTTILVGDSAVTLGDWIDDRVYQTVEIRGVRPSRRGGRSNRPGRR
jgi:hypothetical protein